MRLAYEHAIKTAEHYIYIEDQYAWPSTVTEALKDATDRGVKVILVLAQKIAPFLLTPYHNDLRHDQFLSEVRGGKPENLFVYHLQRPNDGSQIFVHSKLMIIDDRFS